MTGPVALSLNDQTIKRVDVESAQEMYEEVDAVFASMDITILCAAVADYRPMKKFDEKMKKESSSDVLNIQLTKTIDIASTLGSKKTENQLLVGFALETNNEFDNAKDKLNRKNLDFIVLNSLNDKGAGFRHDTNKVTILNKKGEEKSFGLKSKIEVAKDIIDVIMES